MEKANSNRVVVTPCNGSIVMEQGFVTSTVNVFEVNRSGCVSEATKRVSVCFSTREGPEDAASKSISEFTVSSITNGFSAGVRVTVTGESQPGSEKLKV